MSFSFDVEQDASTNKWSIVKTEVGKGATSLRSPEDPRVNSNILYINVNGVREIPDTDTGAVSQTDMNKLINTNVIKAKGDYVKDASATPAVAVAAINKIWCPPADPCTPNPSAPVDLFTSGALFYNKSWDKMLTLIDTNHSVQASDAGRMSWTKPSTTDWVDYNDSNMLGIGGELIDLHSGAATGVRLKFKDIHCVDKRFVESGLSMEKFTLASGTADGDASTYQPQIVSFVSCCYDLAGRTFNLNDTVAGAGAGAGKDELFPPEGDSVIFKENFLQLFGLPPGSYIYMKTPAYPNPTPVVDRNTFFKHQSHWNTIIIDGETNNVIITGFGMERGDFLTNTYKVPAQVNINWQHKTNKSVLPIPQVSNVVKFYSVIMCREEKGVKKWVLQHPTDASYEAWVDVDGNNNPTLDPTSSLLFRKTQACC